MSIVLGQSPDLVYKKVLPLSYYLRDYFNGLYSIYVDLRDYPEWVVEIWKPRSYVPHLRFLGGLLYAGNLKEPLEFYKLRTYKSNFILRM